MYFASSVAFALILFSGIFLIKEQSNRLISVDNVYIVLSIIVALACLFLILSFIAMIRINKNLKKSITISNALLKGTPDCLLICNKKGQITFVNTVTEKVFGYTQTELLGQNIEILIPERYNAIHKKHTQSYFKNPKVRPMGGGLTLYGAHKDGHEFPVEISLSPIETTKDVYAIASIRDISQRKQMEALLAESEERWKFALESGKQGVWDWYVAEEKILFSHTWKSMLGYSDDEIGSAQSEFESRVHPDDLEKVWEAIRAHFDGKSNEYTCEVRFRCKDGRYKWILARGQVIQRDENGQPLRAIGTHTDINELKEAQEKLKHLAQHDQLTGLINRPFFEDRLTQTIALAKRHHNQVAVLFLDIDGFKQVNDTYGHAMGDLLLYEVAHSIQKYIRSTDTLARFGGDEFAIIITEIKSQTDLMPILQKIIRAFAKEYIIKNHKLAVTLSIGVAIYPKDGHDSLIEKADAAMYYVKQHGKNNFQFYDKKIC